MPNIWKSQRDDPCTNRKFSYLTKNQCVEFSQFTNFFPSTSGCVACILRNIWLFIWLHNAICHKEHNVNFPCGLLQPVWSRLWLNIAFHEVPWDILDHVAVRKLHVIRNTIYTWLGPGVSIREVYSIFQLCAWGKTVMHIFLFIWNIVLTFTSIFFKIKNSKLVDTNKVWK